MPKIGHTTNHVPMRQRSAQVYPHKLKLNLSAIPQNMFHSFDVTSQRAQISSYVSPHKARLRLIFNPSSIIIQILDLCGPFQTQTLFQQIFFYQEFSTHFCITYKIDNTFSSQIFSLREESFFFIKR